jgi:hypothetical protein
MSNIMQQGYPQRPTGMEGSHESYDSEGYDKEVMDFDPQGRSGAALMQRRAERGAGGYGPAAGGAISAGGFLGDDTPYTSKTKGNRKWLWAGLAAFVLIGLGVGLGVGLTVGKKGTGTASSSASGNTNTNTNTTTATTTGGDPSVFERDSRLHDSFWAFAYTPQVRSRLADSRVHRLISFPQSVMLPL